MNITSAKYLNSDNKVIIIVMNEQEIFVPINLENRHYAEIMRQVEAGELTIAPAEEE